MRGSARYFSFSRMNLARFLIKIEEGNTRRRRKSNSVRPFKETGKGIATKGTKSTKLMIMSFVLFVPFVAIPFPVSLNGLTEFDFLLRLVFPSSIFIRNLARFIRLKEKYLAEPLICEDSNWNGSHIPD